MRNFILALALLLTAEASAQQAYVIEISPDNYVGVFVGANGLVQPISKLTIFKATKPPDPIVKVDKAVYVYEKDDGPVPPKVAGALNKLKAEGKIDTSEFEKDTTTGSGSVPAQFKSAREAAIKSGLPALVVQAGETIVRVVKSPKTEQEVFDAVK